MAGATCKGKCLLETFSYKVINRTGREGFRKGYRSCLCCDLMIECDLIHCPCCNTNLRIRPRHGKARKEILNSIARY